MIDELKKIVSETMKGSQESWESSRELYFWSTYSFFLSLAIRQLFGSKLTDPLQMAVKCRLIDIETQNQIEKKLHFKDIYISIKKGIECNLNDLYQSFAKLKYTFTENGIQFEENKYERDVLGAYYTSEKFATEITRKAILKYFNVNKIENISKRDVLTKKIMDPSCGSGVFLIAYIRLIKDCFKLSEKEKKQLMSNLYGIDVDPLAILIAKTCACKEINQNNLFPNMILGNPLLFNAPNFDTNKKIFFAARGQFYNQALSINLNLTQYDIILGNPPWEKIRFEEKKFTASYCSFLEKKGNRQKHDAFLKKEIESKNKNFLLDYKKDYEIFKKNVKKHPNLKASLFGELNTCSLFLELCSKLVEQKNGVIALIVKTSILVMPAYKRLFENLLANKLIQELLFYKNSKKIFDIDSREEFTVAFLKKNRQASFNLGLNLKTISEIQTCNTIKINKELLEIVNPLTKLIPNVRSPEEMSFLIEMHKKFPLFSQVYNTCRYGRLVHFTNHLKNLSTTPSKDNIPVYEGKFIELYTAKFSTFKDISNEERFKNKASARLISNIDGSEFPESRYYIKRNFWKELSKNFSAQYIIAWRSLTSATNSRTTLATLLPFMPTSQSIQFLQADKKSEILQILCLFNSIVFDVLVRMKLVGLDLTQTMIKQIPVPHKDVYEKNILFGKIQTSLQIHINSRIKALYKSDCRMDAFFKDVPTYIIPINTKRKDLIRELDSLMAFAYGFSEKQLANFHLFLYGE